MRSSAQALCLLLVLALGACVDLSAVREFAKTSAATADYHRLVDDYIETPSRRARWEHPSREQELTSKAAERERQRPQIEAAQAIIVSYMSALGEAAADDLPNVNSEVDALGAAVEKGGLLEAKAASAAAAIAKILVRIGLDGWRQSQVKAIVTEVDPHLQNALAGLTGVVTKDFVQDVASEQEAVERVFDAWSVASEKLNDPGRLPQPLAVIRLERRRDLEGRKTAAHHYAAVLAKIGEGHAQLAADGVALDDKQLVATLKGFAMDLQAMHRALRGLSN